MKYLFYLFMISLIFTNCTKDDGNLICNNNNIPICESPIGLYSTSVDTCFDLPFSNTGQVIANFKYNLRLIPRQNS